MKYRLYLRSVPGINEAYDEAKAALPAHAYGKGARVFGHPMFEGDAGILYIEVSDLAPDVSSGLAPFVTRVTVMERIYAGFRTEGVYEIGTATLWLKNSHEETGNGYDCQTRDCQDIEIYAPSIESARAIYEEVRTGMLAPTLDFEAGGRDAPPPPAVEDPHATEFWARFHSQDRDDQ